MKKLLLVCAVAGVCSFSNVALSSDRVLSSAWTGVSDSMGRVAKTTMVQAIAASISGSAKTAASIFVSRGERAVIKAGGELSESSGRDSNAGSCPFCPEPPCD